MRSPRSVLFVAAGIALVGGLSACGKDGGSSGAGSYDVKAGDHSCEVEKASIPAGASTFKVENTGNDVTEVYVYGKSGDDFTKIMGEVENIGPGTSRDLDVNLQPGHYQVACKPGMVGDGYRSDLSVTGASGASSESGDDDSAYDRELEFEVESAGKVKLPADVNATAGEKVEFVLENDSSKEYYLELLDPAGEELGEAEAAAGGDGEFVAELRTAGTYTIKTFAEGAEDTATTHALTVSAAS
jgi:plastocyanin